MKNKRIFIYGTGLALAILALAAFLFLPARPDRGFRRLQFGEDLRDQRNFRLDEARGKIFLKSAGGEIEWKGLPSAAACFFKVAGEKKVEIAPPFSGPAGFYCYLYMEGANGGKITFKADWLHGDYPLNLARTRQKEQSLELVRFLQVAGNDRLRFSFQGNGSVYFSKPIFYRRRKPEERQYVFLIGVDTLRGDHIGMKVHGHSLTPRLDSFKQDGVDFSRCYAQSNWTLPSFMSLFTAQYEFNHLIRHGKVLAADKPFLVKELSQRFITVSLNGGGYVSRNFGFSRNFDYFASSAQYSLPNGGELLFRKALDLVDRCRFPQAFFFLHTYQVHTPFKPPEKFLREINPHPLYRGLDSMTFLSQKKRFMPIDAQLTASFKELYQAEVLAFDSYLGDFVDALKKRGIYDNSMIIVMADHGEEFWEHGGWGHGHSMYDEVLRVPLIIKFPGEKFRAQQVGEPVGVIDIIPSILDFFKIDFDTKKVDGLSLLPLLRGETLPRQHLYSSVSTCQYFEKLPARFAVIDSKYKVIVNYAYTADALKYFGEFGPPPQPGPAEIYDLFQDRDERHDLYGQRPDVYGRLLNTINAVKKRLALNFAMADQGEDAQVEEELRRQMQTLGYL